MRQLIQHRKDAVGFAMMPQDTHRPGDIYILQHEGDVYQIDRGEKRFGSLDIRHVQLEPGKASLVARPRLLDVSRVEVHPNDPADAGNAVEAIAARTSDDGHTDRGMRSDEAVQLICNEPCLTDRRQRHMRLIVGQRNVEPGIAHECAAQLPDNAF